MKEKVTYSALKMFKNCQRKYKNRYIREIVAMGYDDEKLFLGSLIHNCLEIWYKTNSRKKVLEIIPPENLLARAMIVSYIKKYATEPFEVVAVEKEFSVDIINPETNRQSKSFTLAGKVDAIVKMENGQYYILEHKTASSINNTYLDALWTDFQIIIYSLFLGVKITGVVYNIIGKAKLKQAEGETEEEYQERRSKLMAKNKSFRTSAKRKMPESDQAYFKRLLKKYKEDNMFHREEIIISKPLLEDLKFELWDLTQALLDAKNKDRYYKNGDFCFNYNSACQYYELCKSCDNEIVLENLYEHKPAHEELEGK